MQRDFAPVHAGNLAAIKALSNSSRSLQSGQSGAVQGFLRRVGVRGVDGGLGGFGIPVRFVT